METEESAITGNMKLEEHMRQTISIPGTPISSRICIYRVRKKLRELNPEAYTPQAVSIGPLHHGEEPLKFMETQKLLYLQIFLKEVEPKVSLQELLSYIREEEATIREYYLDAIDYLSSDAFVKMVLVDSVFIIILFLRYHTEHYFLGDGFDAILGQFWLLDEISIDLQLLENQLPFYVITKLYDLAFSRQPFNLPSFADLTLRSLNANNYFNKTFPEKTPLHFTDFFRYLMLPPAEIGLPDSHIETMGEINHYLLLYSASKLHEAGVEFQRSDGISFSDGKLLLPGLQLDMNKEFFIKNILALEQYYYPLDAKICDYIVLLDYLVNTEKDVELLVQNKIIFNFLGSHQEAANLINKLGKQVFRLKKNHYGPIFRKLNKYYETPRHRWKATLKQQYFSTPMRGASTIAAIILLILTLLQTIFSGIAK